MIKQRISRGTIFNRLQEIEKAQENQKTIKTLCIDTNLDGRLFICNDPDKHYFENMFDCEAHLATLPGFTSETILMIDSLLCESDELYLPGEPILYFATSEQRSNFISATADSKKWLTLYIELIQKALKDTSFSEMPGSDSPALQDLIKNHNSIPVKQLVERYKNQQWFDGNKYMR